MTYEWLKIAHVGCAVTVFLLLFLRIGLAVRGRNYRQYRLLRWFPHLVDSLLLLTAALLVWRSALYPFAVLWLTAKVLALPFYIIGAALAFDPQRQLPLRIAGGVLALVLLLYIVAVAHTHRALPYLP